MSKLSQEIKECVSCPQINGKPYGRWGTLNSKQRINIWNLAEQCEFYEELADKSMEKLTKYKRAFKILKDKGFDGKEVITRSFSGYRARKLINEEAELLEELMANE